MKVQARTTPTRPTTRTTWTPTRATPPGFLALVGHPIRWRVLVELARSDRRVDELTDRVGEPQGLVSYHLGRLRTGGLVSSRRSSKDARAVYYRVELHRCGESLAATGTALHPGLGLSRLPMRPSSAHRRGRRVRVLFVCTGNSARSQIAEALLQHVAGERVEVASAGSAPKPVHPNAVQVLAERGLDIRERRSKSFAEFAGQRFDYVVTLCDKVRERCPEFADDETIHWSVEDPSDAAGTDRQTLPRFRRTAEELDGRIGFLVALIDNAYTGRLTP